MHKIPPSPTFLCVFELSLTHHFPYLRPRIRNIIFSHHENTTLNHSTFSRLIHAEINAHHI